MDNEIYGPVKKAFTNRACNKIYLKFPNGNGISTIWGWGTYSETRNFGQDVTFLSSDNVEIMIDCDKKTGKKIAKKYGKFNSGGYYGGSYGNVGILEWLDICNILAKASPLETEKG